MRVEITDPRLTRPYDPADGRARARGRTSLEVDRRGKYLIVRFESGRALLIHLRMTGSLRTAPAGTLPDDPHRRAVARLDDGSDVAYRDVRRFGTWLLLEPAEVDDVHRRAGRPGAARAVVSRPRPRGEPEDATRARSRPRSSTSEPWPESGTSTPTKRSGARRIHPLREAARPRPDEVKALHRAIRRRSSQGIKRQGVDPPRLRPPGRRLRLDAARVQGLRPRRRAVPIAAARRSRRSASPGAAPGTARRCQRSPVPRASLRRREQLVEPAGLDEPRKLGVAADRTVVDRICGTVQLPVRSSSFARNAGSPSTEISSYGMFLRVEQSLRANAVSAPLSRVDNGFHLYVSSTPQGACDSPRCPL